MSVEEVTLAPVPLSAFAPVIGEEQAAALEAAASDLRSVIGERTIWNVNSTASGGGVAEMLQPLLAYGRGAGFDVRWVVITGSPEFFVLTKRLHHCLHGSAGDGGDLGDAERSTFDAVTHQNLEELLAAVRPGDVVICHDPQTAGLVHELVDHGVLAVWRSHVGTDEANEHTRRAWAFLQPYVAGAHHLVFSRQQYVPDFVTDELTLIPPSIDPFSPKNRDLSVARQRAILGRVGILTHPDTTHTTFTRRDGSQGRVDRVADVERGGAPPSPDVPLVVQVSRWDPLKDMAGVMRAFAEHVNHGAQSQLVLAGPNVTSVTDDPEGADVLDQCTAEWRALPHSVRARIALVCLPMADPEENAIIVNALQRHARVVVQKSLQEGFGLTVSEAMWKGRPVVGSKVGGIQDQIVDGETGRLVDPNDLAGFGRAVAELLADEGAAEAMGTAAKERVRERFLGSRDLMDWAGVLAHVVDRFG